MTRVDTYYLLPKEKVPDFVLKCDSADLVRTFRICAVAIEEYSYVALWNLIVAQCVNEHGALMSPEAFISDFLVWIIREKMGKNP